MDELIGNTEEFEVNSEHDKVVDNQNQVRPVRSINQATTQDNQARLLGNNLKQGVGKTFLARNSSSEGRDLSAIDQLI